MKVRAGLLTCELRCGHRDNGEGLPVCTVAWRQTSSLTVARQRGVHTRFPVPPQWRNARTKIVDDVERTARNNNLLQERL
jgi:hypothetical protein